MAVEAIEKISVELAYKANNNAAYLYLHGHVVFMRNNFLS
jgi:hypothetical protein